MTNRIFGIIFLTGVYVETSIFSSNPLKFPRKEKEGKKKEIGIQKIRRTGDLDEGWLPFSTVFEISPCPTQGFWSQLCVRSRQNTKWGTSRRILWLKPV